MREKSPCTLSPIPDADCDSQPDCPVEFAGPVAFGHDDGYTTATRKSRGSDNSKVAGLCSPRVMPTVADRSETTVLVPVDASDPGTPSPDVVELLGPHELVVLGIYPVPDQAIPDQLRSQFGDEAAAAVESVADRFADRGAGVETRVVFSRDRDATIEHIAAETGVDAVLTTGGIEEELDRVLVPIRGAEGNIDEIVGFLGLLLRGSETDVTLFNVADSDDEASSGEFLLRGVRDRLEEDGIDPDRIAWQQERDFDAGDAIVQAAAEHDLLVVGETEPSLRERLLGEVTNQLIAESPVPVLVVRRDR